MALNIKDSEAERLAAEVAALTGESKTRAVRTALAERRDRLRAAEGEGDYGRVLRFMEEEIWPQVQAAELGKLLTKAEREDILGIGPEGA